MGLLRILLAICVFCSHAGQLGGLPWMDGDIAVESFFVISGFYMSLVLSSRYTKEKLGRHWKRKFYLSRYARVQPIYLAVVLAVICLSALYPQTQTSEMWRYVFDLPSSFSNAVFKIYLIVSTITLFFQDFMLFISSAHEALHFPTSYLYSDQPLWHAQPIPPAWSLSLELLFYLCAPFVLKWRDHAIIAVIVVSLAAKLFAVRFWGLIDPWTYRFFPFEIGYFLLGALAHRHRRLLSLPIPAAVGKYLTYLLVIAYVMVKIHGHTGLQIYPVALAVALPFMFKMTATSAIDRWLGELSYPFYIIHMPLIGWIALIVGPPTPTALSWIALAATLAFAIPAAFVELRYIQPWRERFAQPQKGLDGSSPASPVLP